VAHPGLLRAARLAVLALAGAAALWAGLSEPLGRLRRQQPPYAIDAARQADEVFAAARARYGAGARVGVVLPTGIDSADMAIWYSSQYALAPALVEPISLADCTSRPPGDHCRLERVEEYLLPVDDPALLAWLDASLGLRPAERLGGAVRLRRGW
jgi:hypothetical protein